MNEHPMTNYQAELLENEQLKLENAKFKSGEYDPPLPRSVDMHLDKTLKWD